MTEGESVRRGLVASHWGVGVGEVRDGRLVAIRPHPSDPDPSPIDQNYLTAVDGGSRVRRPAVRRGFLEAGPDSRESRGAEPFVEVSWDDALDLAASELDRVRRRHGPAAIFGGSYGWASAGRFHHAQSQIHRFLNCAGGYTASWGNYSYHAALALNPFLTGVDFRESLAQATRWRTVEREGRLVVMFGGVPPRCAQISGGGLGRHALGAQMRACRDAGVDFVAITPFRRDALGDLGATWLAPRPGSDTAIMLGLAHTLLAEGLHDADFLGGHTVGFDRVAAYLRGETDGVEKSADWAAALSEVDAETLRGLARRMAAERTLILTAAALQRAEYGEQPLWATITLAAMLGQIGLPGGGFGFAYGADATVGVSDRPFQWPSLPQGENSVKETTPVAAIADMLLNPGGAYEVMGRRRVYPDIRMVWWAGGNPFHHHQDLHKLQAAFRRPETVIVNEIGWTATARSADIVFPATTTLERTDFAAGHRDRTLTPMPQLLAPTGDARDDYDIFSAIAGRLGFAEAFTEGRTARDWLEVMWLELRQRAAERDWDVPELDAFLAGDVVDLPDPNPDQVYLAAFRADPEEAPLATPSGKLELFSETIAGFGYDDCPGQATWLPPREWLGAEAAARFPLHMVSGQPASRLHSQLDQGATSAAGKIAGREAILIHPEDAKARGIADGDVVRVFNDRGACLAGARLTTDVRPRVVFLPTGAWYDPVDRGAPDALEKHGNPNVLTHDRRTSRLSQGPASHSALVEIERYDHPLPPITAFDPPVTPRNA